MQLYDSQNGEYTDQEKQRMRFYDNFAILSFKWNGEKSLYKFHFPIEGVHEKEYCQDFVCCVRNDIREPEYNEPKMNYLLTLHRSNDKSKFLKGLGYSKTNPYLLFHDICSGTKRDTIEFSRFSHNTMLLKVMTILKDKTVTSVWKLDEKLRFHFVTLIPGGYKNG